MNFNKGFTLIELLVVVAIIGVLSTIVITNLSSTREGANDAAIKANLSSIRTQAEVYFNNSLNYGDEFLSANCGTAVAGSMFVDDSTVASAITSAKSANSDNELTCAAIDSSDDGNADSWAVLSPLRSDGTVKWCVDSTGFAGEATGITVTAVAPIKTFCATS